jgi:plastocyanin
VNYVSASASYVINVRHVDLAVSVTGGAFAPDPISIAAGTSVTWTNATGAPCTLQSATAPWSFSSGSLAPSATYSHAFVSPGTYNVSCTPGGFQATINVTGAAASAVTTYSGGQIYRFRCDDDHDAIGAELVYELRFQDWAGNVTITDSGTVALINPGPGQLFCSGDGLDPDVTTACPCANFGSPGHGCAHSFNAAGALLKASGSTSLDTVLLSASGLPATSFTLFMQHDAPDDRVFHDGVLCANGTLIRLRGRGAVAGEASFPNPLWDSSITLSQRGSVTPGSGARRYYAGWYRNASTTFCPPATANVTNGWILDW